MSRLKLVPMTCIFVGACCLVLLSGCSSGGNNTSSASSTPTSDTQTSSSGDIPDTQAFVTYTSTQGSYKLDVPEGWARTITGTDVSFTNTFDGVQVALTQASTAPTVESVRSQQAVELQNTGRAVRDVQIKSVQLDGGSAILMTYTSDSEPNAVTGKQVRLENNRYFFFKDGKLAALTLWAPVGADNVDQWNRMANSFRWL
jgi:hypothetical protein